MSTFIGIDLAWKTDGNHTGVAVLSGSRGGCTVQAVSKDLISRAEIVDFVARHSSPNTVIAIDASLVVPNQTGQRVCEKAIGKVFGRFGASCHSTHRGRPNWDAGSLLLRALERQRFVHDFEMSRAQGRVGRWVFEVYPHPAMIRLFGLSQRLQYKKGNVDEKRAGLAELRSCISKLPGLKPSTAWQTLLEVVLCETRGEELKRYEDSLDAVFCAYLAWHCWCWGAERNDVFGTLGEGYIVVAR